MTKERFAEIKKEYFVTDEGVENAISIVMALLEEKIEDLIQNDQDINQVDIAADEVADLCLYIEEVM